MTEQEAYELLKKYKANQCSEAEKAMVDDWFLQLNETEFNVPSEAIEEIGQTVFNNLPKADKHKNTFKIWPFLATAAALLILTLAVLFYFQKDTKPNISNATVDIPPGSSRATIILANGKRIALSDQKRGVMVNTDRLIYDDGDSVQSNNNGYQLTGENTIVTPKGGEYQIVLPDGTKVWLNAASAIKFPASFNGSVNRSISLSGEAYFEVAKDHKHPFVVTTGNQEVKVLGTIFNINAYSDQPEIKTSLVEGSVKVTVNNGTAKAFSRLIKPGEQSVFQNKTVTVKAVDLGLETAWKNGKIQFENTELKNVMAMLSRWYNINVEYQYYPSAARFSGSIARSKNISEILELLESTGDAHFKISGRRVVIMK